MRLVRKGQGFAEVEFGDLTVFALSDGFGMMKADCAVLNGAPLDVAQMAGSLKGGKIRLEVYAFLIRGPGGTVLIDAGGGAWHQTTGRLLESMAQAGISPDEVDQIALTHTHIDHIDGLLRGDGSRSFPNARRILVPTEELAAFRAAPGMGLLSSHVLPLEQGDGVMPGVVAINAPGHSAGHMAFLIDGRLLIWGDLVHLPGIQFARPEVAWKNDADPALAVATRLALFDRVLSDGLAVAGAHLTFPAIGHILRTPDGLVFDPVGD